MNTWAAVIIGAIGGGVYYVASKINLNILKIDDPLDAIAVHAGCGLWGLLGTAAFAAEVSSCRCSGLGTLLNLCHPSGLAATGGTACWRH